MQMSQSQKRTLLLFSVIQDIYYQAVEITYVVIVTCGLDLLSVVSPNFKALFSLIFNLMCAKIVAEIYLIVHTFFKD